MFSKKYLHVRLIRFLDWRSFRGTEKMLGALEIVFQQYQILSSTYVGDLQQNYLLDFRGHFGKTPPLS